MKKNQALLEKIEQFVSTHSLVPADSTVVLGLSGGPDSAFLLHLLANVCRPQKNITLIAAHLDHGWRPDSHTDVAFCRELTQQYDVPFVSAHAQEFVNQVKQTGSQEEMGRNLRRLFLQKVRAEHNAEYIALAHHAQDQQETFFIRLIRGTTLSGLIGMKPKDGVYIRPLLEINKADIIDFLDIHNIAYLIDPTNISDSFLRNRIRNSVLPALNEVDKRFDANFLRTHHHLQEAEQFLEKHTQKLFTDIATEKDSTWFINIKKLSIIDPFMQRRIIMHWLIIENVPFTPTEQFLAEIDKFLFHSQSRSHQLHETWSMQLEGDFASAAKKKP